MVDTIHYDTLANFDIRQSDNAIAYIKAHANGDKPFFMDVNFIKMHNPTNAAPDFRGKSHLGDYSDSLMELDADIGRIMDEIRAEAPNTIVILTADNGAWLDAYPDAGTTPFRGEKGSAFEGGWRVPGIMWWPGHIPAGAQYDEMMSHIDCWATLATMAGLTPPPHEWVGNDGKPIYFDSIDNSAYILGKAPTLGADARGSTSTARSSREPRRHRRRSQASRGCTSRGNTSIPQGLPAGRNGKPRVDRRPVQPHHGPVRKIRHGLQRSGTGPRADVSPGEGTQVRTMAGRCSDRPVIIDFDKSITKYPSITRYAGGASNDLVPDLQHPENPLPLLSNPHVVGGGGG